MSLRKLNENLDMIKGRVGTSLEPRQAEDLIRIIQRAFPTEVSELRSFYSITAQDILGHLVSALEYVREKEDAKKAQREFFGGLTRILAAELKRAPQEHSKFDSEKMGKFDRWNPLLRVIVATRMQELQGAKVLYRGGKYDLSGVRQTLYGRMVLDTLGFGKRYVLSKDEYERFEFKTREMGFELPQEISPTMAEKYFEQKEVGK